MTCWTAFLSVVFPPLAVLDKGCGAILLVTLLWFAGGVPGMIAALIINGMKPSRPRYVHVPAAALGAWDDDDYADEYAIDEQKRKGAYIRLADGEIAEVIDDDGALPGANDEKRKRSW